MSKEYMWQTTLNEIANLNMGQSPDSLYVGAEMLGPAFLQGCAEFGPKYPNTILFCSKPKKMSSIGDTLMSVRAPVGEINKADRQYCIGRGLAAITFKNGVSNDFGWHLLKFWGARLDNVSQGSTFSAISKNDLADLTVFIFEEDIQKVIVLILDTLDNLIFQTEAVIEKLNNIKTGLMHDLLTKGIDENGEIRDPEKHPEQFKDSPLGKIPKDWDFLSFEESQIGIIDGDRGHNYPSENELYNEGYCLFLSANNVTKNGFKFESSKYISEQKDKLLRKGKLERNDIVLTTRGTVGNFAFFSEDIDHVHMRINSGMVILRNMDKKLDNNFLYISLTEFLFKSEYNRFYSGSAQPQLPIKDFIKFHIIKPTLEEQDRLCKVASKVMKSIDIYSEEAAKLYRIKKGLMQDLLTGEVSVSGIAKKLKNTA